MDSFVALLVVPASGINYTPFLQTVATACIFLASKVEETPCSLSRVIPASYEIIYKKDPVAVKRIQSKVSKTHPQI